MKTAIRLYTTLTRQKEPLQSGHPERVTADILTGEAQYWSRRRKVLWHHGGTSGLSQHIIAARIVGVVLHWFRSMVVRSA